MKKIILLIAFAFALPLIGCASITDHATPVFNLPQESLEFADITNAPPKLWFGLANTKAQLLDLQEAVKVSNRKKVFDIQQLADREKLEFQIATERNSRELLIATDLQQRYINPAFNGATAGLTGLLGLGVGGTFIRRRGDLPKSEVEEKIKAAGLQDPEQFKQTLTG